MWAEMGQGPDAQNYLRSPDLIPIKFSMLSAR